MGYNYLGRCRNYNQFYCDLPHSRRFYKTFQKFDYKRFIRFYFNICTYFPLSYMLGDMGSLREHAE